MAVHPMLRRIGAVVAGATVVLAVGPVTAAHAAPPALATDGQTPAPGAFVKSPTQVVLCFTGALGPVAPGDVVVRKGSEPIPGSATGGSCAGGTNNRLLWTAQTGSIPEGPINVQAIARNAPPSAEVATFTWGFTVDNTPPVFTAGAAPLTTPITGPKLAANEVTFSGNATDVALPLDVDVTLTDKNNATTTESTTLTGSSPAAFTIPLPSVATLADGQIAANVTVTDSAGNVTTAGPYTAHKDATGPALTGSVPAQGASVKPLSAVTATFDEAIDQTTFGATLRNKAGNAVAGSTGVTATTATFTAAAPLSEAGSPYVASFSVRDALGNAATRNVTFSVDSTAPAAPASVAVTNPVNATTIATATVTGSAEPGSSVTVKVDDPSGLDTLTATGPAGADGAFSIPLPAAGLAALDEGTLTAKVTATDAATNKSAEATATTVKDTIRPAVTGLALAVAAGGVTLTGTTENGLGVTAYLVDAAGNRGADVPGTAGATDGTFALTLPLTGLTDTSTVTAHAYATDAANNTTSPVPSTKLHNKAGVPAIAPLPMNIANADETVVSGTTTPNAVVGVVVDDANTADATKVTATVPSNADGAYTTAALDLTPLADGPVTVTVTTHDGAGTVFERAVRTVVKDTEAPAVPSDVVLSEWVNTATLAVSGVAPAGTTVTVTVGDGVAEHAKDATQTVGDDGAWSVEIPVSGMNDGPLAVSAVASDAHGNPSVAWTGTVQKDTVAPAAPATLVLSPDPILTGDVDAVSASGTGAEPGSTVIVTLDDTDAATPAQQVEATADAAGAFTAAFPAVADLADGVLTASATVRDAAGNTGAPRTDTATMDTTQLFLVSRTPAPGAFVQDVAEIRATFNEPLHADSTLTLTDSTLSPIAGTTALSADKKSLVFTPAGQLSEAGSLYRVVVDAQDALGNDDADADWQFTVDRTAPALGTPVVNGGQPIDAADAQGVVVTGTSDGATVTVSADDATAGNPVTQTIAVQPDGTYSATLVLVDAVRYLADGPVTVTVTARDAAGNETTKSAATTMDATAPAAPAGVTLTDPVNKAKADQAVLAGTGEPNAVLAYVVENSVDATTVAGTVAIGADGTWTKTLDLTSVSDGAIRATATVRDAIGNESSPTEVTAAKDATPPAAPSVTLSDPVNKANTTAATVSGTTEPGLPVVITITDSGTGSVSDSTVEADDVTGAFSKSFDVTSLADGVITAKVVATDAVGNVSPVGSDTATKDSQVPDLPVLSPVAEITHATHTAAPFSGTAEPGAAVTVTVTDADGAFVTGGTVADQAGAWSKALDVSALKNGTLTVTVTATDAVLNTSESTSGSAAKNSTRAFTIAVGATPVSGAAQAVTVTAHRTYALDSATDTAYTGTPVLTSLDGHFTAGTCAAAVDGVATCTGTVFGDLGLQTLRATSGSGSELVEGASTVTVQPTGLAYSVAPPATAAPDVPFTFTVVPTVGVAGASITGYTATRTISSTGGSLPSNGSALNCPTATCEVSVRFPTRGPKTLSVVDNGTPARQTPVATVTIPYRTAVPIFRSASVVPSGQNVLLIGELSNLSTLDAVPGKRIEIWRKVAPATTFSRLTAVTTDADGVWFVITRVTRNTTYQARFLGDTSYLPSNSSLAGVKAAQVVSSTWSRSGRTVKATGRVTPNAAGRTVYLQYRKSDGTWAYAGAKATVTSTGTYTVSRTFSSRQVLRVYVPATAVSSGGVSKSYTFTV